MLPSSMIMTFFNFLILMKIYLEKKKKKCIMSDPANQFGSATLHHIVYAVENVPVSLKCLR